MIGRVKVAFPEMASVLAMEFRFLSADIKLSNVWKITRDQAILSLSKRHPVLSVLILKN